MPSAKLVLIGLILLQATALEAATDTPESVAKAYQLCLVEGKPTEAIDLVAPEDIARFEQIMKPMFAGIDPSRVPVLVTMFGDEVTEEALLLPNAQAK